MKNLRFLLVSLFVLLTSGVSATEVTIVPSDLDPVTSSDYTLTKDGVMMAVTASTVTNSEFRIFKGQSIAFAAIGSGSITKVVFTCTANGTEKYGPGNFTGAGYTFEEAGNQGTWEGNAAAVALTAESAQVRCTKIVVTLGEGGKVDPGNDDDDDNDGLLGDFNITSGQITDNGDQVLFDFKGVTDEGIEVTGRLDIAFEKDLCKSAKMSITFPTAEMAQAAYQEALASGEEDGMTDIQLNGNTLSASSTEDFLGYSKITVKSMLKLILEEEETGYGILESPFVPIVANVVAGTLEQGETTDEDFYVKGKIASIKESFSAQYGNATFFISVDGKDDYTFQVYRAYYLENKKWEEGNTQIKVGDEVVVCGKLTNYKGTPETAQGKAYIYSLNGVTKNENSQEEPNPEVKELTVAEALELIAVLEDGKTTTEEYLVKGIVTSIKEVSTSYGNATFNLGDNATDAAEDQLTIYRAKGFDNEKIADESIIKVGDEVVVKGKLQKYVSKSGDMTPEISNGYIYSVNGKTTMIADLTAAQQQAVIYNLAGQRLAKAQKGLNIINGKKVMVK